DADAALDYAHRALAANPLDARLRDLLADTHRVRARTRAAAGDLAAAAADLDEAVRLRDGRPDVGLLALAAAVALKAGNTAVAEERVRQASTIAPAAAAYSLAVEA